MVLLVEGPDQHPHWARTIVPRGLALACVAIGAIFQAGGPPLLRAMFLLDLMTMFGSESAVHVYLSTLSQTKKVRRPRTHARPTSPRPRTPGSLALDSQGWLLMLILIADTTTLVSVLAELPDGWAATLGRILIFCMAFGCSAGCWASLLPGAVANMDDDDDDDWGVAWEDEHGMMHLDIGPPEPAAAPVHWPQPLELPEAVALKARHEIPEAFVCPLTMGVMRQPAITPRGTTYEFEALVRWIDSRGRYPAGEAGALYRDELAPNLALRNLVEAWVKEQTPPPPPPPAPAAAPAPAPAARPSRSPARRRSRA